MTSLVIAVAARTSFCCRMSQAERDDNREALFLPSLVEDLTESLAVCSGNLLHPVDHFHPSFN